MPNQFQLAFLASFSLSLAALVLLSHFLAAKLADAGYPISHLILIGIDTDAPMSASSFAVVAAVVLVLVAAVYAKLSYTRSKPLDPNTWKEFPLLKKTQVSPNTAVYRFKLPRSDDLLGLPIGQHIAISAEINGKNFIRNYTPISLEDERGHFDVVIKTYEQGNISKHVSLLKIGQKIRVKGPKGAFLYTPNLVHHLTMIAGGTGIAPMVQLIRSCLRNPDDNTRITLVYANVNVQDILLKDDLDQLQLKYGDPRFTVFYVLNNPPPVWTGGAGFVTKDHIKQYIPNPATTNSKLLLCGPPPMINAMKKNLEELGYPVPNTISKPHDKVFVF